MSWTLTVAEKIRKGESLSLPLHLALTAATPATRIGMLSRKLRTPVRVNARVISVGNLTVGGTGKTPAVIRQLDQLPVENGSKIAVLTRGYGTGRSDRPLASSDVPTERRVEVLGDEPALILQKHPHVLVVKSHDRIAAARFAIEEHGCDTLVLDDGFQYLQLHRDVNQLLIDATNPFGNGYLLPRGILREPVSAVARATEILLTRCDQAQDVGAIETAIRQHTDAPIEHTVHRPTGFVHLHSGNTLSLETFKGRQVAIASAIGNPDAFRITVESLGIQITESVAYRDHARISANELAGERPVIVTEKDAVKIENAPENLYALSIALEPWD